jgi:hypothetical protein
LKAQFMKQWDMMLTNLHYAERLLNLFLMNIMKIQNNGSAEHALNKVVQN